MSVPIVAPAVVGAINEAHQRCRKAATAALDHARTAGQLLVEAKATVAHGEWGAWVQAHCRFSERLAQTYMRIAREWPLLLERNPQRVADLSVRAATALLEKPRQAAAADPWAAMLEVGAVAFDFADSMTLEEAVAFLRSPHAQHAQIDSILEAADNALAAERDAGFAPGEFFETVGRMAAKRVAELECGVCHPQPAATP